MGVLGRWFWGLGWDRLGLRSGCGCFGSVDYVSIRGIEFADEKLFWAWVGRVLGLRGIVVDWTGWVLGLGFWGVGWDSLGLWVGG